MATNNAMKIINDAALTDQVIDFIKLNFLNGKTVNSRQIAEAVNAKQYVVILKLADLFCSGRIALAGRRTGRDGIYAPYYTLCN